MISKACPFCGKKTTVNMTDEKIREVMEKNKTMCIQDIIPDESSSVREWFISGMCPDCQSKLFGESEEE